MFNSHLLLFFLYSLISSAPPERPFCEKKPNGWYTHPKCNYLYKCQSAITFEIPLVPDNYICALDREPLGSYLYFPDPEYCKWKANGIYSSRECRHFTTCWKSKGTIKGQLEIGAFLCETDEIDNFTITKSGIMINDGPKSSEIKETPIKI